MDDQRLTINKKAFALSLCSIVFAVVYNFSMWHVSNLEHVESFVFDFEKHIPFLSWSIIPYMTSGVFLCLIFFLCKTRAQLQILTKRMLFITVLAGLFFVLFPLKFLLPKPDVGDSFLNFNYYLLELFDSPFNQSPSLHIAYAYVFWTIFRTLKKGWRSVLMICLLLLGISTLTTYQHHFLDILTGSVLAHLSFIIFPENKNDSEFRNFHIANFYFLFGWIFVTVSLLLNQFFGAFWLILIWPAIVMFIVGYHYQKNNIYFLKDKSGQIAFYKKLFYFPYIFIYRILWIYLRKNQIPLEILPQVFISSRLSNSDLKNFPVDRHTFVYDLSAEIEEHTKIRDETIYFCVPYLDIASFDLKETENLITKIAQNHKQLQDGGKILIHCTMGYSRSSVIGILLMKKILSLPIDQAITKTKSVNEDIVIHTYVIDFLKKLNI